MIVFGLILFGLCFGSFINALVWRLHAQDKKIKGDWSISKGRSKCITCEHLLSIKDLVPFFSWLSTLGMCRYCHKKIDDNPVVELLLPILFTLSFYSWPYELVGYEWLRFIVWLLMLTGMLALAVYDLRWMELPNKIVYTLFGLVVIYRFYDSVFISGANGIREAVLGALIGGGIFCLLFFVSQGNWIGGGDVKLGFVLGIWLGGPIMSMLMLFMASILGSIIAIPLLISSKKKKQLRLPFGPFLITATVIATLYGSDIIKKYYMFSGL